MVRELASAYPEIESLGASDEIGGFPHPLPSTCQSKLDHVAAGRHPVTITLLNGERVVVDLNACDSVLDLRRRLKSLKPTPQGVAYQVIHGTRVLRDHEVVPHATHFTALMARLPV